MPETNGGNGKKQLAGMALWIAVVPVVLTIITQALYVVFWQSRTAQDVENRLAAHSIEIERIWRKMEQIDTAGTRPVQSVQERVLRLETGTHDLFDRFEKLRESIIDLKTPLALRVDAMDRHLNELTLKVNARLMENRR